MQKKLVIVEDRPEIVTLIKASFKGTDFETYDAANGDDGIALVEKEMPDLAKHYESLIEKVNSGKLSVN